MENNFENLKENGLENAKSIFKKYKKYFIAAFVVILIMIIYFLIPKSEKVYFDYNITSSSNNMELILSNPDLKNQFELNDVINVNIGKDSFRVPIVDNTLFMSFDDNYAFIDNNNIIIGSKHTNFHDKIDASIKEAKVDLYKKNNYKYGDYLEKNELNKVNYRDFSSDYEFINFLHLNNTNLYSSNFELTNDTRLDVFEKIIEELGIKDLIIYNMEYNDFIYLIRTNDASKHIILQNIFNENRILTIEPIDYNKIDNFYKRFNQIIKMIYNNDGPYVFVNTLKNDEIVIYNIIFDALQNKDYNEMLNNYISFYRTYYKYNDDNKLLVNNFDK